MLDSGNSTSAVVNGAGITIEGGSGDDATFTYSTTGPKFELKLGSSYEDLQVDQLIAASLDISGDVDVDGNILVGTFNLSVHNRFGLRRLLNARDSLDHPFIFIGKHSRTRLVQDILCTTNLQDFCASQITGNNFDSSKPINSPDQIQETVINSLKLIS